MRKRNSIDGGYLAPDEHSCQKKCHFPEDEVLLNFMMIGDANYFHMMRENVQQIISIYPDSRIFIFDYGLNRENKEILTASSGRIEIIDWQSQLDDISIIKRNLSDDLKRKLTMGYNARRTGFLKRVRKFFIKRFPESGVVQKVEYAALRFENLLLQKIKCMQHASHLCAGEKLIYLDSDALLFKPIDDVFEAEADINITLIDGLPCWDINNCSIVNSGVIFFNANTEARNAFLGEWWEQALVTDEWLREQTAITRLLEKESRAIFEIERSTALSFGGVETKVRFLSCNEFNFFQMENREFDSFPDARIFHFTDRRQEKDLFNEILSHLRNRQTKLLSVPA